MYGDGYDPAELNLQFDLNPGKNHCSILFESGYGPEDGRLRCVAITNGDIHWKTLLFVWLKKSNIH